MKTNSYIYMHKVSVLILPFVFCSCLKQKPDIPNPDSGNGYIPYFIDWEKVSDSAQSSMTYFWNQPDKYFTSSNNNSNWTNYWPTAHGIDVLVDLYKRKPSASTKTRIEDVLKGLKIKNGNSFINYYYDDMEWLALACLRAYVALGDDFYKEVVDILWADIKAGWSSDLGGGIWWRKDNSSKNTPSNMPAAILAARLFKVFNRPADLQWAKDIYQWQKTNLFDQTSGWVYDNIDRNGIKNQSWKFTYNQGTFLGAALELFKITGEASFYDDAIKAADFAINSGQLTANGVLKDEGGGDGGLFKGIFVRYLTRLIVEGNIETGKKTLYLNFLKKNAETLWLKGTDKTTVLFNSAWDRLPGPTVDFTVQLSGVMLFESLIELKTLNLLK